MYRVKLKLWVLIVILFSHEIVCSLDGTVKDVQNTKKLKPGEDPCNPLYWYPKAIPAYCYKKAEIPEPKLIPLPIPAPPPPMPAPCPPAICGSMDPMSLMPFSSPMMMPMPGFAPYQSPLPSPYMPQPVPTMGQVISYMQVPGQFNNMYNPQQGLGLVPGLPGLVTPNGGINVMPFSDAYSDLLEHHKQKMIRKHLQRLLEDFERYPYKGSRPRKIRRSRRHPRTRKMDEHFVVKLD